MWMILFQLCVCVKQAQAQFENSRTILIKMKSHLEPAQRLIQKSQRSD
jgi:hypothetical protein